MSIQRIFVKSPKTEHHEGGDSRVIPMFEGIEPLLEAVFNQVEPGSPYVIARRRGLFDKNKDGRIPILAHYSRSIFYEPGDTPWLKLFHAMRASLETDLSNDGRVKPHTIARNDEKNRNSENSAESGAAHGENSSQEIATTNKNTVNYDILQFLAKDCNMPNDPNGI